MNKFELVSNDDHQMSVAGGWVPCQVWYLEKGGAVGPVPGIQGVPISQCIVGNGPSEQNKRQTLMKNYLSATSFSFGGEMGVCANNQGTYLFLT